MNETLKQFLIMEYLKAAAEQREARKEDHSHIDCYNQGLLVMVRRVFKHHKLEKELDRLIPNK